LHFSVYDNGNYLGSSDNEYYALIDAKDTGISSCTISNATKIIAGEAFYKCGSLTSITIPDNVTSIGSFAFEYCSSLGTVTLGQSVTSIGDYSFYGCDSLTSIIIPDNVTSIGDGAFLRCSSLGTVTLGQSVTSIGSGAFSSCSNLTSIIIPDNVTSIGSIAFYGCSKLGTVTLGQSVTFIGERAFDGCDSLKFNEYDNGKYLGTGANQYQALIKAKDLNITSCEIPDTAKIIAGKAFSSCSKLASITIPGSVTSIGSSAFSDCYSLKYADYFGISDPGKSSNDVFSHCPLKYVGVPKKYADEEFCGIPVLREESSSSTSEIPSSHVPFESSKHPSSPAPVLSLGSSYSIPRFLFFILLCFSIFNLF